MMADRLGFVINDNFSYSKGSKNLKILEETEKTSAYSQKYNDGLCKFNFHNIPRVNKDKDSYNIR